MYLNLLQILEDFLQNFYIQSHFLLLYVRYDLNVVLYQLFDVQQN
jgi:hypothetical protein